MIEKNALNKMNKVIVSITLICVFGLMISCNNNQGASDIGDNSFKKGIVYNEKIQDTFYGVSFGASTQEVINGFVKQNLWPDQGCSTS